MNINPDNHHALDLIGFSVLSKRYSSVRAIFAELGESDTLLLRALKEGHGIEFDSLHTDQELFFVIDQDEVAEFQKFKMSPTWLQLLGNCRVIALTKEDAIKRFREMIQ